MDLNKLPEPLTDTEKRIFLAAMSREEEICKLIDEKYKDCEDYCRVERIDLVPVCHNIMRKVKKALWK